MSEELKSGKTHHPARSWSVAVIANIRGGTNGIESTSEDAGAEAEDAGAEDAGADQFERPETIQAICEIIQSDGHKVEFIPAGQRLPAALAGFQPDICFNIAEGAYGDGREAQVPALLELMQIPYTASRLTAQAIALNKAITKRIWRDHGLPVAKFQEFSEPEQELRSDLEFPLFVKPVREGSSMGIAPQSIIRNRAELRHRVKQIIRLYRQPALVEEYLPGREFTVPILGSPDYNHLSRRPEIYGADGFFPFLIQEIDTSSSDTPSVYSLHLKKLDYDEPGSAQFLIPAPVSDEFTRVLHGLAKRAHQAIGAMDISRIDIRLNRSGDPCLMEINTLPGIVPGFSEFYTISERSGLSYRDLILEILYLGAARFHLLDP